MFLEDFSVGDEFTSPGITLTETQIIDFGLRYDPQPFHVDVTAAAAGPFGGLIASGFHTAALSFRLFWQIGLIHDSSIGSPGIDELRWLKPVRPGDTLRVSVKIIEVRRSTSKPDRGVVRMQYATLNQKGETVMTLIGNQLLRARPAEASGRVLA
ncbi:MAG: MaoC family dehydratase [Candidatus Rokubacteria bacterium]|nr:MaoC family dehydratase [Candidatus Rokubacteria bacterium]